ncbi:MAG: T9SS type A sorting domain-containing protein [Bacteroidetes bacterium]|nr:T9SS type A sorting domain-containing protein [Bacteroidota bacterium]
MLFQFYPNPATSIINILDESNQLQNTTIQIQNYLGQIVFTTPFSSQINLSSLSAGMYFLTIEDKYIKKIIKIIKE